MQPDEAERKLHGVCSNCKQVRRQLKIVQAKRKDLVGSAKARCQSKVPKQGAKARRQEASSKVI